MNVIHEFQIEVSLTAEIVRECLSLLCKTGDGMAHAFVRFIADERLEFIQKFKF